MKKIDLVLEKQTYLLFCSTSSAQWLLSSGWNTQQCPKSGLFHSNVMWNAFIPWHKWSSQACFFLQCQTLQFISVYIKWENDTCILCISVFVTLIFLGSKSKKLLKEYEMTQFSSRLSCQFIIYLLRLSESHLLLRLLEIWELVIKHCQYLFTHHSPTKPRKKSCNKKNNLWDLYLTRYSSSFCKKCALWHAHYSFTKFQVDVYESAMFAVIL